jgi:hypothetical protein
LCLLPFCASAVLSLSFGAFCRFVLLLFLVPFRDLLFRASVVSLYDVLYVYIQKRHITKRQARKSANAQNGLKHNIRRTKRQKTKTAESTKEHLIWEIHC